MYFEPHYAAPLTGLTLALLLLAMQRLRLWRSRGHSTGLLLTRAAVTTWVIMAVVRAATGPLHLHLAQKDTPAWYQESLPSFGRAALDRELQLEPGHQLILVRYGPEHNPFEEWVYNEADIDHARVVWAREMDSPENKRLLSYFKDRHVWLLEADSKPPRMSLSTGLIQDVSMTK
jgi:hypothetical protein